LPSPSPPLLGLRLQSFVKKSSKASLDKIDEHGPELDQSLFQLFHFRRW
jgi:hypothetical protein